jgi:membrane protein implicated in regulation of membrane protease activity
MKNTLIAAVALVILGIALMVVQMWVPVFDAVLLCKIEWTLAAVIAVLFLVAFVRREYRDHRAIQRGDEVER